MSEAQKVRYAINRLNEIHHRLDAFRDVPEDDVLLLRWELDSLLDDVTFMIDLLSRPQ